MTHTATAPAGIGELLAGYSIEVNPAQSKIIDAAIERLVFAVHGGCCAWYG